MRLAPAPGACRKRGVLLEACARGGTVTDTITVVARQDFSDEILPIEVDVLQRHGEWALVQHRIESLPEPSMTVTHVPSGLALVHVYSFELERTMQLLPMLPAQPVGLPCMLPQTIEDSDELKHSASQSPCVAELKAWAQMWKEAVGR